MPEFDANSAISVDFMELEREICNGFGIAGVSEKI